MSRYGFIVNLDKCIGCNACSLACRMATYGNGKDAWCSVLELNSEKEKRTVWLPYLCLQVGNQACGPEGQIPPCTKACPSEALIYGDIESRGSSSGVLASSGKPLPHTIDEARVYYLGHMPEDLCKKLPEPSAVIPKKYLPLNKLPP